MAFERSIRFEPGIRFECANGSDRCKPGSGGSHGVHGLQIRWILKGEKGAVQFLMFTNWLPEPEIHGFDRRDFSMPADLGYHAIEPKYEDQAQMEDCDVLDAPCYYNGSGRDAEEPFRVLCNEGGDALWEYLEAYYHETFESVEMPKVKPFRFARRQDALQPK